MYPASVLWFCVFYAVVRTVSSTVAQLERNVVVCYVCLGIAQETLQSWSSPPGHKPGQMNMEDQLLPMQQISPLHFTDVNQGNGKDHCSSASVTSQKLPGLCCIQHRAALGTSSPVNFSSRLTPEA